MKHIYYISYEPGMAGEFLCCQISKDKNFYPNLISEKSKHYDSTNKLTNRYGYRSVLDHALWFLQWLYPVPDEFVQHVTTRFSEKHIIARTHGFFKEVELNIPQVKKIKLYCNEEWWLYFHLLEVIKIFKITTSSPGAGMAEYVWDGVIYDFCKFPTLTQYFLDNLNDITLLEFKMITEGFTNCRDLIKDRVTWYQKIVLDSSDETGNWTYINNMDLFLNPEIVMPKWKELFDLSEDFDFDLLRSYHASNLQLIEKEFGMTYEQLRQGDYITEISSYCENMRTVFTKEKVEELGL